MHVNSRETLKGTLAAACAFLFWGLIPVYWKLIESVNAYELVCHRIFWSLIFLLFLVKIQGRSALLIRAFQNKAMLKVHALGGGLLALNWIAFIIAVTSDQVLQASLAYFMVPLVNCALGFLVLKERLSKIRIVAILLAGLGVLNEVVRVTEVPWFAFMMAGSFGFYGLLKKKSSLGTLTGLAVENSVIFPFAAVVLGVLFFRGEGVLFHASWEIQSLVVAVGIVTSIPLLLFSYGAARIQLNTLGVLQFIGPIVNFILAVWLFREPFSSTKFVTFLAIWMGLILYLWDSFHASRIKDVQPDL